MLYPLESRFVSAAGVLDEGRQGSADRLAGRLRTHRPLTGERPALRKRWIAQMPGLTQKKMPRRTRQRSWDRGQRRLAILASDCSDERSFQISNAAAASLFQEQHHQP